MDASRLTPSAAEAQRRFLWAVEWMLLRGDGSTATTFAGEVAASPPGPLHDAVLGSFAMTADDPDTAGRLLAAAWAGVDPAADPATAAVSAIAAHEAVLPTTKPHPAR